jgi:hypothetical protein
MNGIIESVGTNDLSSVAKKVVAASVLSMEAFPMPRLALQLEEPTVAAASIPGWKVEECWNSGLDG